MANSALYLKESLGAARPKHLRQGSQRVFVQSRKELRLPQQAIIRWESAKEEKKIRGRRRFSRNSIGRKSTAKR